MNACRTRIPSRASLALLSVLAGCADDGRAGSPPAAPGSGPPPVPVAAALPAGSLDGTYEGTLTPEIGNPECGFSAPVGYDVSGTTISLRTRRQSRALSGMVDASGRFSMTSPDGREQVVGAIRGTRLTATETAPPHHHRHDGGNPVPGGVCTAQITADRIAAAAAASE